jgi:hypothetical protein
VKVAIIARGIGHELATNHGCDVAIGINHAAGMYVCDWWCFADAQVPQIIAPIGEPRWSTNARTVRRMLSRGIDVPRDVLPWELFNAPPPAFRSLFSSVWAVLLAKFIGATEIVGFGLYTVNFPQAVDGEADRWIGERIIWNETLDAIGIKVCPAS